LKQWIFYLGLKLQKSKYDEINATHLRNINILLLYLKVYFNWQQLIRWYVNKMHEKGEVLVFSVAASLATIRKSCGDVLLFECVDQISVGDTVNLDETETEGYIVMKNIKNGSRLGWARSIE